MIDISILSSGNHRVREGWDVRRMAVLTIVLMIAAFSIVGYSEASASTISITGIAPNPVKWGKVANMTGSTTGATGDTVTIKWGDGLMDTGIPILPDGSWNKTHTYGKASVGTNVANATLINGTGFTLAVSSNFTETVA